MSRSGWFVPVGSSRVVRRARLGLQSESRRPGERVVVRYLENSQRRRRDEWNETDQQEGTAGTTRRQCLKTAAATGAAMMVPTIIPASALGRGGAVAPSERITLGAIGIGSRGEFDLGWMLPEPDVQFVAICDARKERREAVKKIVDKQVRQQRLQDVPGDARVPGHPHGHRRAADRHRRPLARHGDDHGDAGGQGRLLREALVHDDRRGPRGGRDGPALRPDLPDRHPAAQRGELRRRHRDGPHRAARARSTPSAPTSPPGTPPR